LYFLRSFYIYYGYIYLIKISWINIMKMQYEYAFWIFFFLPVINFHQHYSCLHCHIVLQYGRFAAQETFLIIKDKKVHSFLTIIHSISEDSLMIRKFKRSAFMWDRMFCNKCIYRYFWHLLILFYFTENTVSPVVLFLYL